MPRGIGGGMGMSDFNVVVGFDSAGLVIVTMTITTVRTSLHTARRRPASISV